MILSGVQSLIERISNADQLIFVLGSGLTAPVVPDVKEIVRMIRARLPQNLWANFDAAVTGDPNGNPY